MRSAKRRILIVAAVLLGTLPASCKREERNFHPVAPFSGASEYTEDYEKNAYNLNEGKRLYSYFNCVGCHAHGGGAIGPPLIDEKWIYGYEPRDIYTTIDKGRPGGMPAYGDKTAEYQIWQLVAYVRSMSGLAPGDAAPGRDDHLWDKPPEHTIEKKPPVIQPPPPDGTEAPKK